MPNRARTSLFVAASLRFWRAFSLRVSFTFMSVAFCGCGDGGGGTIAPPASDPLVAQTTLGEIRGFEREGAVWFLGIPYAEPPVGDLRFKPPVPVAPWTGTLVASAFGPACPQPVEEDQVLYQNQSEDCLTLNVWTPVDGGKRRPVMYWIHGGGWIYEGTEDPLYWGSRLASVGDVVVVSVEYRLGAFGFTDLSALAGAGAEYAASANAGMLDQLLGLEWVRDHIAAFGGDPTNVTIFGESAGGSSVAGMMAMPDARNLFHRAIAQSASLSTVRGREFSSRVTEVLMEKAGVDDLAGLVALGTEQLLAAQEGVISTTFVEDVLFGMTVDGVVLPEHPITATLVGNTLDVPLLLGTNKDEVRLYTTTIPLLASLPVKAMVKFFPVAGRAIPEGESADSTALFYAGLRPSDSPGDLAMQIGTDIFFRIPSLRLAEAHAMQRSSPVFVYRFDYEPPAPAWPELELGSPHGAELGFVFGTPGGWLELYGDRAPELLQEQMILTWSSFARDGLPSHATFPQWPAYDLGRRPTMIFDTDETSLRSRIVDDPDSAERLFWESVPFDGTRPSLAAEDL